MLTVFRHGNMRNTIGHVKNMDFQDLCHKRLATALAIYLSTLQMQAALEIVIV
jgi:hypothetical protein